MDNERTFVTMATNKFRVCLQHEFPIAVVTSSEEYPVMHHAVQRTTLNYNSPIIAQHNIVDLNANIYISDNQHSLHLSSLTLRRPLLLYGYSYKTSCARLGKVVICFNFDIRTL